MMWIGNHAVTFLFWFPMWVTWFVWMIPEQDANARRQFGWILSAILLLVIGHRTYGMSIENATLQLASLFGFSGTHVFALSHENAALVLPLVYAAFLSGLCRKQPLFLGGITISLYSILSQSIWVQWALNAIGMAFLWVLVAFLGSEQKGKASLQGMLFFLCIDLFGLVGLICNEQHGDPGLVVLLLILLPGLLRLFISIWPMNRILWSDVVLEPALFLFLCNLPTGAWFIKTALQMPSLKGQSTLVFVVGSLALFQWVWSACLAWMEQENLRYRMWVLSCFSSLFVLSLLTGENPILTMFFISTSAISVSFSAWVGYFKPKSSLSWLNKPGTTWLRWSSILVLIGIPLCGVGAFLWLLPLRRQVFFVQKEEFFMAFVLGIPWVMLLRSHVRFLWEPTPSKIETWRLKALALEQPSQQLSYPWISLIVCLSLCVFPLLCMMER